MRSRIYQGRVTHARNFKAKHKFQYGVYFYAFDIDELEELSKRIPFFSYNHFNLLSIHDKDYLQMGNEKLRTKIIKLLESENCLTKPSRITLVTSVRFLNYVFNPVSIFYCFSENGKLFAVIVNVNNTFSDSHIYVLKDLKLLENGYSVTSIATKVFHVSPFFDIDGHYEFKLSLPEEMIDIQINLIKEEKIAFAARLTGNAMELNTKNLTLTLLKFPLSATLTMYRICYQAAKLYWQKKLPVYPRPNPVNPMTVRIKGPGIITRIYIKMVFSIFKKFTVGELELILPDNARRIFGQSGGEPKVRVEILNWDFFSRLAKGSDIGLGESYMNADWKTSNIADFLKLLIKNWKAIEGERGSLISRSLNYIRHLRRPNTLAGSRKNISEHYDLSNDFFSAILDRSMMYSSAIFPDNLLSQDSLDENSLYEAQMAKIHRIIDKAEINESDYVLEIGCGWGGFAIEVSRKTSCRVLGITVSNEQLELGRKKIEQANLSDKIKFELCDYRKSQGRFSKIVSIEMLEAVGHRYLEEYFKTINRLLLPGGIAVIQVITIPDKRYADYCRSSDFIRKHIFPGGHLPCFSALKTAAEASGLIIENVDNIGLSYAPTLKIWRERLKSKADEVKAMGFDDVFMRKWEFYFAYCEAGFAEGIIDDLQFCVRSPENCHGQAR